MGVAAKNDETTNEERDDANRNKGGHRIIEGHNTANSGQNSKKHSSKPANVRDI